MPPPPWSLPQLLQPVWLSTGLRLPLHLQSALFVSEFVVLLHTGPDIFCLPLQICSSSFSTLLCAPGDWPVWSTLVVLKAYHQTTASDSPGNVLRQRLWRWPLKMCFRKPSRCFWHMLRFENHCSTSTGSSVLGFVVGFGQWVAPAGDQMEGRLKDGDYSGGAPVPGTHLWNPFIFILLSLPSLILPSCCAIHFLLGLWPAYHLY